MMQLRKRLLLRLVNPKLIRLRLVCVILFFRTIVPIFAIISYQQYYLFRYGFIWGYRLELLDLRLLKCYKRVIANCLLF